MNETQMGFGALMTHVLQSGPGRAVQYSALLGNADGPFIYGDAGAHDVTPHFSKEVDEAEEALLRHVGLERLGRVIDIGAGGGRVTSWLRAQGVRALACEPDHGWQAVHTHLELDGVLGVKIQDVQGKYDTAVCFGRSIPCHERSPLDALAQATAYLVAVADVVRPGGLLLLDIMNHDADLPGLDPHFQRAHTTFTFDGRSADSNDLYPHRAVLHDILGQLHFYPVEAMTTAVPMGTGEHHRWTAAYVLESHP